MAYFTTFFLFLFSIYLFHFFNAFFNPQHLNPHQRSTFTTHDLYPLPTTHDIYLHSNDSNYLCEFGENFRGSRAAIINFFTASAFVIPFGPSDRPNWQISLTFHILQLVKSQPFQIPKAWKRYHFQEESLPVIIGSNPPPPPVYGSIVFPDVCSAITKIQTIWIVSIQKRVRQKGKLSSVLLSWAFAGVFWKPKPKKNPEKIALSLTLY